MSGQENQENILGVLALEQIKRFLSDDRTFFDASLIQNISSIMFSKQNTTKGEDRSDIITDVIITFSKLADKYMEIERKYNKQNTLDHVDLAIINLTKDLAIEYVNHKKTFSPYETNEKFKNHINESACRLALESSGDLRDKCSRYISQNDVDVKNIESFQDYLEAKISSLDVLTHVEHYTKFITDGASSCSTLDEFIEKFGEVLTSATSVLAGTSQSAQNELDISSVMTPSFFDTVIRDDSFKVKCGISIIDAITNGGFDRGRIYMFGGKTGGGKSTFILNIMHGMVKSTLGLTFSDVDLLVKEMEGGRSLSLITEYLNYAKSQKDHKPKKKIILYITLENSNDETLKRLVCRIGLTPNIIWMMMGRDPHMAKLFKTKGFDFDLSDLPTDMDINLKIRLYNMSRMAKLMCSDENIKTKIIWKEPYSITATDIFLECKKYERLGYEIDAIFVDYPDKMKAIEETRNSTDQNWLELGKIIDNLKGLATIIKAPIIVVTQLKAESNKDNTKMLKKAETAGSMQKEHNVDTHVNLKFIGNTDDNLEEKKRNFKEYQMSVSNYQRACFSNLINPGSNIQMSTIYQSFQKAVSDMGRASDLLMFQMGMPEIQSIEAYITKNRDGISDMAFESYIVYGMYMVTDQKTEAMESAKYAVDTYMLLSFYMQNKGYISPESYYACKKMVETFYRKYDDYLRDTTTGGNPMHMAQNSRNPLVQETQPVLHPISGGIQNVMPPLPTIPKF